MKLLIVDDEADIRDTLMEIFQDEGYQVATAANGADALQQLQAGELPQAIVLDLLMPVMGGVEMYEKLQQDPRLASIPVIISTSDPSRAPAGALIMKKPIDLERLLQAIEKYCRA